MEWSRIKTIVLMILVITNVSLLAFLARQELQGQQAETEARENAVRFLQEKGVDVEDGDIPQEMSLLPQTVAWDREQEREAAAVLLKGEVQEQAWSDEIYRYYNEQGNLQFHRDGTFQGEFVEGVFSAEGGDLAAYGQELLTALGFEGEVLSVQAGGEETAVTYRQLWQGVPVFNHQAVLVFRSGDLAAMSGRRLTGEPQLNEGQIPISSPTALFQFYHGVVAMGDVCSRIDAITPGYVTTPGAGPSALTPVWYIVTDTRSYRLDTLTGTLSRADEGTGQGDG